MQAAPNINVPYAFPCHLSRVSEGQAGPDPEDGDHVFGDVEGRIDDELDIRRDGHRRLGWRASVVGVGEELALAEEVVERIVGVGPSGTRAPRRCRGTSNSRNHRDVD